MVKKRKCPKNKGEICEMGMAHICKFAKDCLVTPLVYLIFITKKRD